MKFIKSLLAGAAGIALAQRRCQVSLTPAVMAGSQQSLLILLSWQEKVAGLIRWPV